MSTEAATPPAQQGLPRLLLLVMLLLSVLIVAGFLLYLAGNPTPLNDFHVLWSAARYLRQAPLTQVYDSSVFAAFRQDVADPHLSHLPFLYPPCAALLLWPLGSLPYGMAQLAWNLGGLGLYLGAVATTVRPARPALLGALIAPATIVCLFAGQTGLLLGALPLFGVGLLPKRPLLAGVAFGLMAFKPQLALLPGLALLLSGHWRTAAAAAATAALLVLASILAFGFPAWPAWLHQLAGFGQGLDSSAIHRQYGVSVFFALLPLGRAPALLAQLGVGLAALLLSTRCLRRGMALPLLPGLLLASPYAVAYDLPVLAAACLLLATEGFRSDFRDGEAFVLATTWLAPVLLLLSLPFSGAMAAALTAMVFLLTLGRRAPPAGPAAA